MKTNRKLQILAAATVAMLAINPAARAETPAPLSDEMLLHALATGQVGFTNDDFTLVNGAAPRGSQLGVGGGNDDKVANPGTASAVTSYGGGVYLQGQPTANYGGAMYYGGAIYNAAAGSPPVNSWYNDVYGVASGDVDNDGYVDNDCDGIRGTASQPATGIVADDTIDWYGLVGQSASTAVYVYPGLYLQGQPLVAYGGAVYRSTASSLYGDDLPGSQLTIARPTSLYGEDLPGDALYGEDLPGEALWGEELPGEALTDAQLDALILETLARVMDWDIYPTPLTSGRTAGICDQDDNCPVAPMPR